MKGALAEMQTGEGKSLTALLPAIAAALKGRPLHIITVNDYLARRDAEEFGPVYNALGLSIGLVQQGQGPRDRQQAYMRDITYCTNKELVFDYCAIAWHWATDGPARTSCSTRFSRPPLRRIPAPSPARPAFCDRRRSRQCAHRRGAHAAHSVRPAGGSRKRSRAIRQGSRNRRLRRNPFLGETAHGSVRACRRPPSPA